MGIQGKANNQRRNYLKNLISAPSPNKIINQSSNDNSDPHSFFKDTRYNALPGEVYPNLEKHHQTQPSGINSAFVPWLPNDLKETIKSRIKDAVQQTTQVKIEADQIIGLL